MHRSVLSLAAAALIVAGCDAAPSAPEQGTTTPLFAKEGQPAHEHYRVAFARTVSNPCPPIPEPVAVEGYMVYNSHFKFFEGGNSFRIMSNSQGQGVGLVTGVKYQFHELSKPRGSYTYASSRLESDQYTRFHVISATGLGNFFSTVRAKQTCTPEGGCQTVIVSMETDCRG